MLLFNLMLFPNYESYPSNQVANGHVLTLAGQVAEIEEYRHESLITDPWRAASQFVAQTCMILDGGGHKEQVKKSNAISKNAIKTAASSRQPLTLQDRLLEFYPRLIDARNQPRELKRVQEALHERAIEVLAPFVNDESESVITTNGSVIGGITENIALGLFTRYAHPWMVALPALPKHDQGTVRTSNYDLLVSVSTPSENTHSQETFLVQVKTGCCGFCGNDDGGYGNKILNNLDNNLVLVSGCCDLGMTRLVTAGGAYSYVGSVARMLVKEARDVADKDEIKKLDEFSDSLLFNLGLAERRGRL